MFSSSEDLELRLSFVLVGVERVCSESEDSVVYCLAGLCSSYVGLLKHEILLE
jgi:hypothetical protein